MTERSHTDIALLASLLDRPLRVEEAAAALGLEPRDVLELASQATAAGILTGEGSGYVLVGDAPSADAPYVAYLAGALADALSERGPSIEAGRLLLKAGRTGDGVNALAAAALANRDSEAAALALETDSELTGLGRPEAGGIHLLLAIRARNQGDSDEADARARDAVRRLEGLELVDAVGFAAAIASDLQQSQRAEALTAIGAGLAASMDRFDKSGSLLTLQARELARLGFADEADAVLAKGNSLLETHGNRSQRFRGRMNAGWVAFDRGLLHEAEIGFDNLADRASDLGEPVTEASQMAYHSRALAMVGRIEESAQRRAQARAIAEEHGAMAIAFLAALGEAEGALTFARPDDAVQAADSALELAREHVPSWVNRTLHYRAKAALLDGDRDLALRLLEQAREATPPGVDGWRVRNLIRVTELEVLEGDWPQREAEDLTDEFLQAKQYLSAAELLTIRARREKDPELGLQAAALARQVGAPAHAAQAIEAAGAWDNPAVAGPAAELMRRAAVAMPEDWRDSLQDVPAFRNALAAEAGEVDPVELDDLLGDVLASAGLAGDVVLSPAQRRARGLVRRKPRRRRTSVGTWAVGIAAVAALVVAVLAFIREPDTPEQVASTPTTVAEVTTTTLPPIELRQVPLPDLGLFGEAGFRGGGGLTGVSPGGVSQPAGYYWIGKPGGFFRADPVSLSKTLYLGSSTNDEVSLVDLDTGVPGESLEAGGRVLVSAAVGDLRPARGDTTVKMLVFVAEGGTVQGSAIEGGGSFAPIDLGSDVVAAPIIAGELAVVGSAGGRLYGINSDGIDWVYPAEDIEPVAPIEEEAAYADGILYVIDQSGELHLVDADTGTPICTRRYGIPPVGNPVVSNGVVYVQTEGFVFVAEAGGCDGFPTQVQGDPGVANAIAVDDGIIFSAEANRLFPFDPSRITLDGLNSSEQLGPWAPFIADSEITTPPVIADGLVLFGTQEGVVHAIDLESGDEVWRFDVRLAVDDIVSIQGSPLVLKNTVIVSTNGGHIVAIATNNPS